MSELYGKVRGKIRDAVDLVALVVVVIVLIVVVVIEMISGLPFWLRRKRAERRSPPTRGVTATRGDADAIQGLISSGSCLPSIGGGIWLPGPPGGDGE